MIWWFTFKLDDNGLQIRRALGPEQAALRSAGDGSSVISLETADNTTLNQAGHMAAEAIGKLAIFQSIEEQKRLTMPLHMLDLME